MLEVVDRDIKKLPFAAKMKLEQPSCVTFPLAKYYSISDIIWLLILGWNAKICLGPHAWMVSVEIWMNPTPKLDHFSSYIAVASSASRIEYNVVDSELNSGFYDADVKLF
jgi:hypothetical protein